MQRKHITASLIAIALTQAVPPANANETTNSVATKADKIATKTTNAVGHGLRRAGGAIEHAGTKTSEVLHRVATKLGVASSSTKSQH